MNKPDIPQLRTVGATGEAGKQLGSAPADAQNQRSKKPSARRRGVFLLPNIITTASLFAGFYATIAGMNGRFGTAVLAILASVMLDAADGRVARLTRTQSNFGAEYDSLSDMVAFGVAPALVVFSWGLSNLGQVGWVLTFLYIACTALRLARFNTQSDLTGFTGLPSPAAAAVLACTIWVWTEQAGGAPSLLAASAVGLVTTIIALLMVSNFPYYSPKRLGLKGRVPFVALVLVALSFAVLLADPPLILLLLSAGYALSAPTQFAWGWMRQRKSA